MADNDLPRVEGGKLTKPYPIRTLGDVSRARVLPPPKVEKKAAPARGTAKDVSKPNVDVDLEPGDERPKGAIDYIQRRNRMMKGVSGRVRSRSASRRA